MESGRVTKFGHIDVCVSIRKSCIAGVRLGRERLNTIRFVLQSLLVL